MYLLSDYKYFDANLFVLMSYAYASFRQNLRYIYTVYFDICTTLFQQILVVFNTKHFKQIRQVYLLKKRCYTSIRYSCELYQMLWINPEKHLLLLVMDFCQKLYRYRLLLLTAGVHKSLQDGILIGCCLIGCFHPNV